MSPHARLVPRDVPRPGLAWGWALGGALLLAWLLGACSASPGAAPAPAPARSSAANARQRAQARDLLLERRPPLYCHDFAGVWITPREAPAFVGLRLGIGEARLLAAQPDFACESGDGLVSDRTCRRSPAPFAGQSAQEMNAFFYCDRLVALNVFLPEPDYAQVKAALLTQLGTPQREGVSPLAAALRSSAPNRVSVWTQGGVSLILEEYAGRLDRLSVTVKYDQVDQEILRRLAARQQAHARDL